VANRYDFFLYHAYYIDNHWVIEKLDDTSVLFGSTCITFDPDGFLHMLYYDVPIDVGNTTTYKLDGLTDGVTYYLTLAAD
jgi:hypothetical protein